MRLLSVGKLCKQITTALKVSVGKGFLTLPSVFKEPIVLASRLSPYQWIKCTPTNTLYPLESDLSSGLSDPLFELLRPYRLRTGCAMLLNDGNYKP